MQQNRESNIISYILIYMYVCAYVTIDLYWPYRKKKTMKLSRALSDLVKYTRSVGLYDIEAQGKKFCLLT